MALSTQEKGTVSPVLNDGPSTAGISRRKFVRLLGRASAALALAGGGGLVYTLSEARWCRVERVTLPVPNLPSPFVGMTIAFLVDTHYGPFVSLDYLRGVVAMTNKLGADLVALGGDFIQRQRSRYYPPDRPYVRPGVGVLAGLEAPLGRFAVLGNHDHWAGAGLTRQALAEHGIRDLSNTGVWLERGGTRLRFCGVEDRTTSQEDFPAAIGDARPEDACIMLAHNPDSAEEFHDPRVGLMLSGHTHGGQVVLPFIGAPIVPSSYGQKYVSGFKQGPSTKVYISRGVGTIAPPVRFNCPPEVTFITLARS